MHLPTDPKKRRMVLALGGAALLALVVLLSKRAGTTSQTDPAATNADGTSGNTYGFTTDPAGAGPTTFADNGETTGQLSTAITDALGAVSTSLGGLQSSNDSLTAAVTSWQDSQGQGGTDPNTQPATSSTTSSTSTSPATTVGSTSKKVAAAKKKTDRYGRTFAERQSIKKERAAGKVGPRTGLTPTERRIASRSPALKSFTHKKVVAHQKAAKKAKRR